MPTQKIRVGSATVEIQIDDNGKVIDFATGRILKQLSRSPEEAVRQWYEHVLVEECGYDKLQLDIEVPIQMGSTTKKADIVVFKQTAKLQKIVIVETKEPTKKDGIKQLQSYLEATGTEFGVWANGNDISYWYHGKPQSYEPIGRIIRVGETVNDIGASLFKKNLSPAKDLVTDFKAADQYISAHQGGVDIFDEIFKVIFAKIYDEKKHLKNPDSEAVFRAGIKEPSSSVASRVKSLFDGAKALYSDVFKQSDEIQLIDDVLKWVVMLLQNYILSKTDMDVLGVGFEVLVNPKMKSDKGQYFTPRQVVRAAVEMLKIDSDMRILDPACGSGGFLIYSMERVWKEIDKEWADKNDALYQKLLFAQTKVFGADYDDRLARVAKAYMAIWGDGRAHIYPVPCSIKSYEWTGEIAEQIKDNTFDAVLTNPPFAGDISLLNIAHHFDLGSRRGEELSSQRKDILFIERVLKFVKSATINEHAGLIAIVLPKGDLDERKQQYIRDYILEHSQLLAVIALDKLTFVPFTSQKTSLVLMKKMQPHDLPKDYDIFMAVSERSGKDKSGNLVYTKDSDGNIIQDEYGKPKLDTDLEEIAKEYVTGNCNLGFTIKRSQLEGRINAEYYHPKYMKIRSKVTCGKYVKLGDLVLVDAGITNGRDLSSISQNGKRNYSDTGTPYLRVGDVLENEIDLEGAEKIDPEEYNLTRIPSILPGDILLTRKGTTGRAAVVTSDDLDAILSSEIIRIRLKKKHQFADNSVIHIDPYYVTAYINSPLGKSLIEQKQTGGISEGINQPDLAEIEIPFPSQEKIQEIATMYKNANEMLRKARKAILSIGVTVRDSIENLDDKAKSLTI